VYRNQAEYEIDDVDLEEFSDAIEPWVIEALKNIGCDTARQVLELSAEELIRRTDLEEETVKDPEAVCPPCQNARRPARIC
jgi:N utilization substance protein A